MSNPIWSVAHAQTGAKELEVPAPSKFEWQLADVSASDSGRTEDTKMHKRLLGQTVKISLGWQNITTEEASQILKAFNPEYIWVNYLDPLMGEYQRKEFYVGDRSAPLYNAAMGRWSNISFNIIERKAKVYNTSTEKWEDSIEETGETDS